MGGGFFDAASSSEVALIYVNRRVFSGEGKTAHQMVDKSVRGPESWSACSSRSRINPSRVYSAEECHGRFRRPWRQARPHERKHLDPVYRGVDLALRAGNHLAAARRYRGGVLSSHAFQRMRERNQRPAIVERLALLAALSGR
jgi:hypothetical protein